jgi:hypothetical protein
MIAPMDQPQYDTFSPDAAWAYLRTLLDAIFSLFARPLELAFAGVMERTMQRDILAWLRGMEAAARRLLLLEAPQLAPIASAPRATPVTLARIISEPAPRPPAIDWETPPEHWRVAFRCTPPRPRAYFPRKRNKPTPVSRRFVSSFGLAARLEALRRVIENPAPFARRLALRLARAPALIARVLTFFAQSRNEPAGDIITRAEAQFAARPRRDSS